jgi:uncharacterized protein (TIGR02246 family)
LLPSIFTNQAWEASAADLSSQTLQALQTSQKTESAASADEKAIREEAELFAKLFSEGQAEAIANLCSQDCTLTDAQGEQYVGREAILKLYQRCFRNYGLSKASVKVESVIFPAPDVCIEEGKLFVSKGNSANRYCVVHVKRGNSWQMLRITESPYTPQPAEVLKELNWMLGSWTMKDGARIVNMTARPAAGGNFIVVHFSKQSSEKAQPDELQIIGWSIKTRDIVSWHFGADGGFGFGHWLKDGSNWIINNKSINQNGSETEARYLIDYLDNDHFTWQSTNRMNGAEKLPNTAAVKLTRDK